MVLAWNWVSFSEMKYWDLTALHWNYWSYHTLVNWPSDRNHLDFWHGLHHQYPREAVTSPSQADVTGTQSNMLISERANYVKLFGVIHRSVYSTFCRHCTLLKQYKIPAKMVFALEEESHFHWEKNTIFHCGLRLVSCSSDVDHFEWDNAVMNTFFLILPTVRWVVSLLHS